LLPKEREDNKQYGAGGKWNFSEKVSDISTTVNCFLAKTIRRRLKEVKIDK
jgi:tRNA A37 threonylcarbamoyladenosine dehydratase